MTTPAIQNDFSYYRRTVMRSKIEHNGSGGSMAPSDSLEDTFTIDHQLANKMSLFYANSTPMLKILSEATSKFVTEVGVGVVIDGEQKVTETCLHVSFVLHETLYLFIIEVSCLVLTLPGRKTSGMCLNPDLGCSHAVHPNVHPLLLIWLIIATLGNMEKVNCANLRLVTHLRLRGAMVTEMSIVVACTYSITEKRKKGRRRNGKRAGMTAYINEDIYGKEK